MTMMTDLRKLSNHPLLLRYYYKYEDLPKLAKRLAADSNYKDTVEQYIIDDLACMSDFEIHTMTKEFNVSLIAISGVPNIAKKIAKCFFFFVLVLETIRNTKRIYFIIG